MSVSPVSLQAQAQSLFPSSSTSRMLAQRYQHDTVALDLAYSGNDQSVILSLTGSVTSVETLYTEKGLLASSVSPLNIESTAVTSDTTATDTLQESSIVDVRNLQNQYFDFLLERIKYLLDSIADNISQTTAAPESQTVDISSLMSYFSPEETASRILDFALSFYDGGDREEFANMVSEAVLKGYNEALEAFGGWLPPECSQTIELVLEGLDEFAGTTGQSASV